MLLKKYRNALVNSYYARLQVHTHLIMQPMTFHENVRHVPKTKEECNQTKEKYSDIFIPECARNRPFYNVRL